MGQDYLGPPHRIAAEEVSMEGCAGHRPCRQTRGSLRGHGDGLIAPGGGNVVGAEGTDAEGVAVSGGEAADDGAAAGGNFGLPPGAGGGGFRMVPYLNDVGFLPGHGTA